MSPAQPKAVLDFWLGDLGDGRSLPTGYERWFRADAAFDAELRGRFGALLEAAVAGQLPHWEREHRGRLALIILCDQFSRNIYRKTPRAFAQDAEALRLARAIVAAGEDLQFTPVERVFVYLPFEHSENLGDQHQACDLFARLARDASPGLAGYLRGCFDYAVRHKLIVERFGRFPHRNAVLGRASTQAELDFLKEPNSSF